MQNISTSKKAFKTAAQFSLKKDSVLKLFKHLPGTFTSKIELNTAAAAAIMIIIIIIKSTVISLRVTSPNSRARQRYQNTVDEISLN